MGRTGVVERRMFRDFCSSASLIGLRLTLIVRKKGPGKIHIEHYPQKLATITSERRSLFALVEALSAPSTRCGCPLRSVQGTTNLVPDHVMLSHFNTFTITSLLPRTYLYSCPFTSSQYTRIDTTTPHHHDTSTWLRQVVLSYTTDCIRAVELDFTRCTNLQAVGSSSFCHSK
jgi:hypothetical protein